MRIIRQSTMMEGSPYVHLGYISSTTVVPQKGFWSVGWVLVVLGLGVMLAWKRGVRQGTKVAVAASSLSVGLVLLLLGARLGTKVYDQPEKWTRAEQSDLVDEIRALSESERASIASLGQVPNADKHMVDAWRRPMTLERRREEIFIVSRGKDGVAGTEDDIETMVLYLDEPAVEQR